MPGVANAEAAASRVKDECNSYFCFRVVGDSTGWTATMTKTSNEITGTGFQGLTSKGHIRHRVCDPGAGVCW
ncbi:hypothetical protein [Allokutzneria sp. NRRL B-24872]|uniref:hypothetical protein n=1 Tax=Allokutzneria sp. NRRL B-24872 TaxID=1137961 RepID=UPI001178C4D0|nr:hypothetical protein [Allokutzneria sp. NRRL B-24872]